MDERLGHLTLGERKKMFQEKVAALANGSNQSDDLTRLGDLMISYHLMEPGQDREAFAEVDIQPVYERLNAAGKINEKASNTLQAVFDAEKEYF